MDETEIASEDRPRDVVYVERREYGPFLGTPVRLVDGERELARGAEQVWQALPALIAQAGHDRDRIRTIERDEIGADQRVD